ncbi:YdcF family protein [Nocardia sp. NRRL WC-3656]|uniref:YdcF family protein n=1 Tax=Nocardia sp. NRRL WC-3656 TaxID=1463824 RepID=UPI0009DE0372|nr:YdcF family protein [Nocardia sp. NRRL WC-3656]
MGGKRRQVSVRFVALAAASTAAAVVAAAEYAHWRASRRLLGPRREPRTGGVDAVVVLGYPATADGRTRALQRWRCRIGARSLPRDRDGFLIFTGGAVHGPWVEATVMAEYTRAHLGVPLERIRTETSAETTWQNIEFTIPAMERADRIMIASDPMHAARARRYLWAQRPDLAERLVPAADYRPLECWWLKIPTAAHESAAITRRRAGAAATPLLRRLGILPETAAAFTAAEDRRD